MKFEVFARLESPAALSIRRATGNALDTARSIAGTTWRGAVAQEALRQWGDANDPRFRALFLEEGVHFCDLRLEGADPWPLSARRCARFPDEHGKHDLLTSAPGHDCPDCREENADHPQHIAKLTRPEGFTRMKRLDRDSRRQGFAQVVPRTLRVAHVAIDAMLGKAGPGQFHSATVLCAHQTFRGRLDLTSQALEALRKLWPATEGAANFGGTVWIGRGKTRGQGRTRIDVFADDVKREEELAAELRAWSERRGKIEFTVTLLSPAIVRGPWLECKGRLEAADVDPRLGGFSLEKAYRRDVRGSGWHAAAKLPKAAYQAIAPGSVFLFARPGSLSSGEAAELATVLAAAEAAGVGERRAEGFGEMRILHLFHREHSSL